MSGKRYGKTGNPAQRAEMAAKAYALSLKQVTNGDIGAELGVSRETVRTLLREYIEALVTPLAEQARNVELDKLDRLEALAWKVLEDNHVAFQHGKVVTLDGAPIADTEPVFKAMDRVLKVSERRSKYLGLDMPTKSEHIVTTTPSIDASVYDLVQQLNAEAEAEQRALGDN